MGVIVSDRNLSKCEAVAYSVKLKLTLQDLCIRNMGIKNVDSIVRQKYAYGVEKTENREKYIMLLSKHKERLLWYADELIANTRAANRIKMNSVRRCDLRLDYQDKAIGNCEMLVGRLQDTIDTFWVDINRYRQYLDAIDHEIELLKGWEQYTISVRNKLLK